MGEKTCKVFTPPEIVSYMLDKIGYVNHLYGKKFLRIHAGQVDSYVKLPKDIY